MDHFFWPTGFACTVISGSTVLPNSYNLSIGIEPDNSGPTSISLGFKKMRYFIDNYLNNSIFICKSNPLADKLVGLDTNIVYFSEEPYDYYVGLVLYQKLLTITEKYFHIGLLSIDSAVGDHVQYNISDPLEHEDLNLTGNHWWNIDSVDTGLGKSKSWNDLNIEHGPTFQPIVVQGGRVED
jgi:hypothetical protein